MNRAKTDLTAHREEARNPGGSRGLTIILACIALASLVARAEEPERVRVGVRSTLFDTAEESFASHGRIYSILSIQQVSGERRISQPANVNMLLRQVRRELDGHGFHPVASNQKPEIIITVEYGRDWLNNPYLGGPASPTGTGLTTVDSLPTQGPSSRQSVTGLVGRNMNQTAGIEEKLQRATYEKLYLRIAAWHYSADPKAKATPLWVTTMVVDDPDHVDLNFVSGAMLKAGGRFFSQNIKDGEMEVYEPVPDGRVTLGTPSVVAPPVAQPVVVASMNVGVKFTVEEPVKVFDLPAGDAVAMLQAYSRQSGDEIIYPVEQLQSFRTNPVSGELSPRAALDQMLAGTGLVATQDQKTGALVVRPATTK